jgi:phage baseplate assembly protein W
MATTTEHNLYGTNVSLSVKRAVSSKYKKKSGFVYPLMSKFDTVTGGALQKNTSQKGYFSKSYGIPLIENNLRQLILCEKGSRIMLPDYGLSLQKYLFEPMDETTYFLIKNEILEVLNKYFTIVNVITLGVFSNVKKNTISPEKNELLIKLTLQLMDESLDIFDVQVNIG